MASLSCQKNIQFVAAFCTDTRIHSIAVEWSWKFLWIDVPLKLHKRYACVTWFKRKVLNQGLEIHIKLLILSPWLRTFLIYSVNKQKLIFWRDYKIVLPCFWPVTQQYCKTIVLDDFSQWGPLIYFLQWENHAFDILPVHSKACPCRKLAASPYSNIL